MLNKDILVKYISPLSPRKTSLSKQGAPKEKIKCILFDIYGTLFISGSGDISISKRISYQSDKLEKLLEKYGISTAPEELINRFFSAIKKKHVQLKKNGIDCPEVEIDKIWMAVLGIQDNQTAREFSAEYEMIVNPVYPMPNLQKLLHACTDNKIVMGIISNAQFYTTDLFNLFLGGAPEAIGFDPDLIFLSYRFGIAKPSPIMFTRAKTILEKKMLPPRSVLYLGNDMLNDIYPAKQVGFQTALFAGDERSLRLRSDDPRCKDHSPDLVIADLIELVEHL